MIYKAWLAGDVENTTTQGIWDQESGHVRLSVGVEVGRSGYGIFVSWIKYR